MRCKVNFSCSSIYREGDCENHNEHEEVKETGPPSGGIKHLLALILGSHNEACRKQSNDVTKYIQDSKGTVASSEESKRALCVCGIYKFTKSKFTCGYVDNGEETIHQTLIIPEIRTG